MAEMIVYHDDICLTTNWAIETRNGIVDNTLDRCNERLNTLRKNDSKIPNIHTVIYLNWLPEIGYPERVVLDYEKYGDIIFIDMHINVIKGCVLHHDFNNVENFNISCKCYHVVF